MSRSVYVLAANLLLLLAFLILPTEASSSPIRIAFAGTVVSGTVGSDPSMLGTQVSGEFTIDNNSGVYSQFVGPNPAYYWGGAVIGSPYSSSFRSDFRDADPSHAILEFVDNHASDFSPPISAALGDGDGLALSSSIGGGLSRIQFVLLLAGSSSIFSGQPEPLEELFNANWAEKKMVVFIGRGTPSEYRYVATIGEIRTTSLPIPGTLFLASTLLLLLVSFSWKNVGAA